MPSSSSPRSITLCIALGIIPLTTICTELSSPALPAMASVFATSSSGMRFTVGLFFIGYALGEILIGTLSDQLGRKPLLMGTLLTLALTSLIPLIYPNLYVLYGVRFIQGIASAGPSTLARAIVSDSYAGLQQEKHNAKNPAAFAIGTILITILGANLQTYFGWQATFLAAFAIVLMIALLIGYKLPETCVSPERLSWPTLKQQFQQLLSSRVFLRATLILALLSQRTTFSTLGPFFIEDTLGYSTLVYGQCIIAVTVSFLIGTVLNVMFLYRYNPHHVQWHALSLMSACALGFLCLSLTHTITLATLLIPLTLIIFCEGILVSSCVAMVMSRCNQASGITSSAFGCLWYLGVAMMLSISATFNTHDLIEYAWFIVISLAVTLLLNVLIEKIPQPLAQASP